MLTLNSVLPLDVSGAFASLSALLPDLALKGGLLLLLALLLDLALRRASAATRHAHWQLALGGTLALALLLPLLPRVPVALPLPAALTQAGDWFAADASPRGADNGAPLGASRRIPRMDAPPAARVPLHQAQDRLAGLDATRGAQDVCSEVPAADRPDDRDLLAVASVCDAEALGARATSVTAPDFGTAPGTRNDADDAAARPGAVGTDGVPTRLRADSGPTVVAAAGLRARVGAAVTRLGVGGWLTLAWAAGAAVVLVLLACSVLRARAMARAAHPIRDPEWLALLDRTAGELGLRRRVTLLVADGPVVPMTWGHAHPIILLPTDAHTWSPPRRRQVLLHELAHIQRGDWLTQLLAQVACALYWYQPLAWLAARRLRQQREHACDDRVLAAGNRASDYAGHLLDIARTRQVGLTGSFATLAMARPSQLEGRLLAVLDERRDRRALPGRRTLAAAGVAGLLVLALACVQPKASPEVPSPTASGGQPAAAAPAAQSGQPSAAALPSAGGQPAMAGASFGEETAVAALADEGEPAPVARVRPRASIAPLALSPDSITMPQPALAPSPAGCPEALVLTTDTRPLVAGRAAPRALRPAAPQMVSRPDWITPLAATRMLSFQDAPAPAAPPLPPTPTPWQQLHVGQDPFGAPGLTIAAPSFPDVMPWSTDGDWCEDSHQEWKWSENGEDFHVTLTDWIEPDETGTKLGHVGDGAELVIERTHGGTTDRIAVTGGGEDEEGNSVWKLAGILAGTTAEAPALQAELDRVMPVVLAHTAMFAGQRVNYLLDNGGVSAVLAETGALPVECARARWYCALLGEHELGTPDTTAALEQAGRDLPSDTYLAELLGQTGSELLADPDLAAPLFGAVDTLESDSYQAEVLENLLCGEYVDGPVLVRALTSAATGLESDAYAAEVLGSVPGARLRDPEVRQAFLVALDTVGSDAYAAEIFAPLLDQRGVKGETLAALLGAAATSVDSDAYLAEILQSLPPRALADERVRAAALAALATIESDSYAAEVLSNLLENDDLPADTLGALLDAVASGVDSDAYAAEVLTHLPAEAVTGAAVRPHFDAALATIESPSYRDAVLEELDLEPKDA